MSVHFFLFQFVGFDSRLSSWLPCVHCVRFEGWSLTEPLWGLERDANICIQGLSITLFVCLFLLESRGTRDSLFLTSILLRLNTRDGWSVFCFFFSFIAVFTFRTVLPPRGYLAMLGNTGLPSLGVGLVDHEHIVSGRVFFNIKHK